MPFPLSIDCRYTLSQRSEFDEIIDVRTPAEFAEDHIPGARNCPVMSNAERHEIGILYAQSPFEARKLGSARVARNIAAVVEQELRDRAKSWRPLIYCWRGGMRSLSLVVWMTLIGWRAGQLVGGYKTWRRYVVEQLETLPSRFQWRVICGATGSAKTRLLTTLAECGEQTLDLEGLAAHKGSVLGGLPDQPQPSQKWFETRLLEQMEYLDPTRVVYVEAESRKIGLCALPNALIEAIRTAPCIEIKASLAARLAYLREDYAYLGNDPARLCAQLERLRGFIDNATLNRWLSWGQNSELDPLFAELIERHYDPLYAHSQYKHFVRLKEAQQLETDDLSLPSIRALAKQLAENRTRKADDRS